MIPCAQICRTAAAFMLIGTDHHKHTCRECAEICEECAKSCNQVGGMEECAQACRRCPESCAGWRPKAAASDASWAPVRVAPDRRIPPAR